MTTCVAALVVLTCSLPARLAAPRLCATRAAVPRASLPLLCADTAPVSVVLDKPLGMVLEEASGGAVEVGSLQAGSNAERSGQVHAGDTLLKVGDADVSASGFDAVMATIIEAPSPLTLTLRRATYADDAAPLDITPNLAKSLALDDAIKVDRVVRAARAAVRASPVAARELGRLLRIEIVLGAGVQRDGSVKVRWFGIFSSTGSSGDSYSCNVSATGVLDEATDEVTITKLSCAKGAPSKRRADPVPCNRWLFDAASC
jgi:hypothetical protein